MLKKYPAGTARNGNKMFTFFDNHATLLGWLTAASLAAFVGTLIAVPWLIIRLPADYFTHASRRQARPKKVHAAVRLLTRALKNTLGLVLIIAGFIMLAIPGQGLLTIVVGIMVLDFPGKYRLERWLVGHGPVLRAINRIRARAGRPPFIT